MLARLRKSMDEKDQGFTLIELLVVMIIIGILAAIAIPVFLNQRARAVDSSMKSDARTVATEAESFFVDSQTYVGLPTTGIKTSQGNVIAYVGTASDYCVTITRDANVQAGSQASWVFESDEGGLGPKGKLACTD